MLISFVGSVIAILTNIDNITWVVSPVLTESVAWRQSASTRVSTPENQAILILTRRDATLSVGTLTVFSIKPGFHYPS